MATLSVGTMNFGTRTDAAESKRIIARALERGCTHFDTANMYGDGESEKIVGAALKDRRSTVEIATKVGIFKNEGLSKARVLAACDESLQRLGTGWVDLYYLHKPDPKTPIVETLDAIAELLKAGKIRSWGVSNYASWQIAEILFHCDQRGLQRPVISQLLYNLLVRQLDVEYFAFARQFGVKTTVFNPLAGGLLARGAHKGDPVPNDTRFAKNAIYRKRYWNASLLELVERYSALAAQHGLSLVTLAYAWLAGRPGVDAVLSGPGSVAHLDAAIDGCAVTLSAELRAEIDAVHREYLGTDANYAR